MRHDDVRDTMLDWVRISGWLMVGAGVSLLLLVLFAR